MNMLSPITFSRPTWCQPNSDRNCNSIKCNVHFISLWGPSVTPCQRQIPRESGPHGTASLSFVYMELTCPPCVHLWGPWKIMFHVISYKKELKSDMLSLFPSCFWLYTWHSSYGINHGWISTLCDECHVYNQALPSIYAKFSSINI